MAAKINSKRRRLIKQKLSNDSKYYPCVFCKKIFPTKNLTIEHITPKFFGGTNELDNLALSCIHCNCHRNTANFYAYKGWMEGVIKNKPKGADKGGNKHRRIK